MNLQNLPDKRDPGYPSLTEHNVKRRSLLKALALGLVGTITAGCTGPARTAGEMPIPEPPAGPAGKPPEVPVEEPVRVRGKMVAPEPPPKLGGDIVAPAPPALDGRMPIANPPPDPNRKD